MSALLQEILDQKRLRRLDLAALPFPEKVKIVVRMRDALSSIVATRVGVARQDSRLSIDSTSDLAKTPKNRR